MKTTTAESASTTARLVLMNFMIAEIMSLFVMLKMVFIGLSC